LPRLREQNIFLTVAVFLIFAALSHVGTAFGWSNGGYSTNPSNPDYGTHDWIAQHALDWLPEWEKQYILENLVAYLYGTELPDNSQAGDGIGDTWTHHIYYSSDGVMVDDSAAARAQTEYAKTLEFILSGDFVNASKNAGIMTHYIADMAVFGHVMGSGTDWGAEQHHSDYETYVTRRTSNYAAEFNSYLSFDGSLDMISAYDAAKNLAYDTTFDVNGSLTCVWMDANYNWNNPVFRDRCGKSLNLAVNYIADVLHTLAIEANLQKAADFLNNTQYNSTLNLCREAPNVAPNTYWLVHDNLLAYHALKFYYPNTASAIYNRMNQYGYFRSNSIEALFGETLPNIPFNETYKNRVDQIGDAEIKMEICNGSVVMGDYDDSGHREGYADLAIYAALHWHWEGNDTEATRLFNIAKDKWDGKGILDRPANKTDPPTYSTYKLALLLYASRVLNLPLGNKTEIEERLWSMQDQTNGGIFAEYQEDLAPKGDANTETTSLAIIAYKINPSIARRMEVDGLTYTINVRTNSTIVSESFNYNSTAFQFNVTGMGVSFCNITVPVNLNKTAYMVYVNGAQMPCNITTNSTQYFIYLNNNLSSYLITVRFAPVTYTLAILVKDSLTNAVVAGANVTINGRWQMTNSSGYAVFSLIPENYTVTVEKEGYEQGFRTVNVTGNAMFELTLNRKPPPPLPYILLIIIGVVIVIAIIVSILLFKKRSRSKSQTLLPKFVTCYS
jgi:hypothetical protein